MEEADDLAGVIESVRSGATELGFVTLPAPLSGLTAQTLSSQYIVLVCPPGWTGTPATPIPIAEIAGIPLIVDGRHTVGWAHIEQVLHEHSVDVFVAAEVRHPSSALHLVLSGAGAAFMPLRLALLAHRRGGRPAADRPADRPRDRRNPPARTPRQQPPRHYSTSQSATQHAGSPPTSGTRPTDSATSRQHSPSTTPSGPHADQRPHPTTPASSNP